MVYTHFCSRYVCLRSTFWALYRSQIRNWRLHTNGWSCKINNHYIFFIRHLGKGLAAQFGIFRVKYAKKIANFCLFFKKTYWILNFGFLKRAFSVSKNLRKVVCWSPNDSIIFLSISVFAWSTALHFFNYRSHRTLFIYSHKLKKFVNFESYTISMYTTKGAPLLDK